MGRCLRRDIVNCARVKIGVGQIIGTIAQIVSGVADTKNWPFMAVHGVRHSLSIRVSANY